MRQMRTLPCTNNVYRNTFGQYRRKVVTTWKLWSQAAGSFLSQFSFCISPSDNDSSTSIYSSSFLNVANIDSSRYWHSGKFFIFYFSYDSRGNVGVQFFLFFFFFSYLMLLSRLLRLLPRPMPFSYSICNSFHIYSRINRF